MRVELLSSPLLPLLAMARPTATTLLLLLLLVACAHVADAAGTFNVLRADRKVRFVPMLQCDDFLFPGVDFCDDP